MPDFLAARRREILLVVAVAFAFFAGIGDLPLFDWDEGAFSEASREMLVSDPPDWTTAYMNGDLRFAKPILIYWLQAPSMALFGVNEFAARLPSALAAALWALALYSFTRRIFDAGIAFYATFFFATALQIGVIARAAISDAVLNLFIACAMFSVFLYWESRQRRWIYAAFAAIGFGTLTKGPIAIMIPGFASFVLFLTFGEFKLWLRTLLNPIGIVIFLLITAPWYIVHYLEHQDKFIDSFFLTHNIGRFTGAMEGHGGPVFYYIPVMLLGFLPFTSVLVRAFERLRSEWRDDHNVFFLAWFGFVFVFFSLAATKLPHYVIYGYTPLFILMALYLPNVKSNAWLFGPPLALCLLFALLPQWISLAHTYVQDDFARIILAEARPFFTGWFVYAFFGSALIYAALMFVPAGMLAREWRIVIAGFLLSALMTFVAFPTYAQVTQVPVKEAAQLAKKEDWPVVQWRFHWPSFVFYLEKIVPQKIPQPGEIILVKETELEYFREYEVLYRKRGVVLIRLLRMEQLDYARMLLN